MRTRRNEEFGRTGRWNYRAGIASGITAVLVLVGCGGEERGDEGTPAASTEQAPQKAEAAPSQVQPKLQPKPQAGNFLRDDLRTEIDLPDGYPSDAPVYPGSTTSRYLSQDGAVNVTFVTDADPGEVTGFFEDSLSDQGWGSVRSQSMGNSPGTMTFGNKGGRKISILSARVDEGSPDAVTMIMVRVDE